MGTGGALLFLILTALAFAGWLWDGDTKDTRWLMSPYLAVATLFFALSTARFTGGWVGHLQSDYATWFDTGFVFSGPNWFVLLETKLVPWRGKG